MRLTFKVGFGQTCHCLYVDLMVSRARQSKCQSYVYFRSLNLIKQCTILHQIVDIEGDKRLCLTVAMLGYDIQHKHPTHKQAQDNTDNT